MTAERQQGPGKTDILSFVGHSLYKCLLSTFFVPGAGVVQGRGDTGLPPGRQEMQSRGCLMIKAGCLQVA